MKLKSDLTIIVPAGTTVVKEEGGKLVPSIAMSDACQGIDAADVELEEGDEGYVAE